MKIFKSCLLFIITAALFTGCIKQSETKDMTIKNETITKRVGGLIKVRPEFEERYIILHKHTFSGVLESIKRSNIRNYSIFLLDGILFSHYEYVGNNFDADMKAIGDETTKEWWKLTDPMQEPLPTRKEGEWWAGMDLIYRWDNKNTDKTKPYTHAKRFGFVLELLPGSADSVKNIFTRNEKNVATLIELMGFQNGNIYFKDDKIYCYFEYSGADIKEEWRKLSTFTPFFDMHKELSKFTKNPSADTFEYNWKEMKEVFHTN